MKRVVIILIQIILAFTLFAPMSDSKVNPKLITTNPNPQIEQKPIVDDLSIFLKNNDTKKAAAYIRSVPSFHEINTLLSANDNKLPIRTSIHLPNGNEFVPKPGIDNTLKSKLQLLKQSTTELTENRFICIIQYKSIISIENILYLLDNNIRILDEKIFNNSFIIDIPSDFIDTLVSDSSVRWIGEYKSSYKYNYNIGNLDSLIGCRIYLFSNQVENKNFSNILKNLDINVLGFDSLLHCYLVQLDKNKIISCSNYSWVKSINVEPLNELNDYIGLPNIYNVNPSDSRKLINSDKTAYNGSGITIGVRDEGIFYNHPDLINSIDLQNSELDNIDVHGTHVAGIIAGRSFNINGFWNEEQIQGVAFNSSILFRSNSFLRDLFYASDFNAFIDNNVQISNHSYSWKGINILDYDQDSKAIDAYSDDHDLIIIVSAGNEGIGSSIRNPALSKNSIAVGAITCDGEVGYGKIAPYSSRGPTLEDGRLKPELVAPGGSGIGYGGIYSTSSPSWTCDGYSIGVGGEIELTTYEGTIDGSYDYPESSWDDNYLRMSGTSMAAPHVTGTLAKIKEWSPNLSSELMKALLINTTIPLRENDSTNPLGGYANTSVGYGMVNAFSPTNEYAGESSRKLFIEGWVTEDELEDIYTVDISEVTSKLNITMAYNDEEGELSNDHALIDDLDLILISPSGVTIKADEHKPSNVLTESPLEKIVIENPELGTWQVKVLFESSPGFTNDAIYSQQRYGLVADAILKTPFLTVSVPQSSITVNAGEQFILQPTITNTGGYIAAGVTCKVELSNGYALNSENDIEGKDRFVGNLIFEGDNVSPEFTLIAPNTPGDYEIDVIVDCINMELDDYYPTTQKVYLTVLPDNSQSIEFYNVIVSPYFIGSNFLFNVLGQATYSNGSPVSNGTATIQIENGDTYSIDIIDGIFNKNDCVAPENINLENREYKITITANDNSITSIPYLDMIKVKGTGRIDVQPIISHVVFQYDYDNQNSSFTYTPKDSYPTYEDKFNVFTVLNVGQMERSTDIEWRLFNSKNEIIDSKRIENALTPADDFTMMKFFVWERNIAGTSLAENPGRYRIELLIDNNIYHDESFINEFTIGWEYVGTTYTLDSHNPEDSIPYPYIISNDVSIIAIHSFKNISNNTLSMSEDYVGPRDYSSGTWVNNTFPLDSNTWFPSFNLFSIISNQIYEYNCGQYYFNYSFLGTEIVDTFFISEHVNPTLESYKFIESHDSLFLSFVAKDNNHLDSIFFKYNDGKDHIILVAAGINYIGYSNKIFIGRYKPEDKILYWLEIIDESGNKTITELNNYDFKGQIKWVDQTNITGPWLGTEEHPFNTIQSAVNSAKDNDTVLIREGHYFERVKVLEKGLTIASEFLLDQNTLHIRNTIIDADSTVLGFSDSSSVILLLNKFDSPEYFSDIIGLTIQNGKGTGNQGGGVMGFHCSASISHCYILNNTAYRGGGIEFYNSPFKVSDCTFDSNEAILSGGGLEGSRISTISHSIFSQNKAMTGSAIAGNGYNNYSIENCIIVANYARSGGAILYRSVISNSIIAYNTGDPEHIWIPVVDDQSSYIPYIECSIIYGNEPSDNFPLDSNSNNLYFIDPLFCDSTSNFSLQENSPCLPENNECNEFIGAIESTCFSTDIDDEIFNLPQSFSLNQNYPNPFNPSTTIEFELPKKSNISIIIYNMLGQTVIELVNQEYPAGKHLLEWNGQNNNGGFVSSGVYFYKLKSNDFTSSKKMILLK